MTESSADRLGSADPAGLEAEAVHGLLEEGREQGYLTSDHIADALHDVDLTAEQIEEIHTLLADLGIDVIESEAAAGEESTEAVAEDEVPAKLDLSVKSPSNDPLRVYFSEMGKVPLLTAVEEVSLAKRIERHDPEAKRRLIEANLRLVV
ncbi:MAG: hypothetical protein JW767_08695, partial [Thermoleophilia bacterium]|nr:hypothetical protein [Thermoleophilia bacterium]